MAFIRKKGKYLYLVVNYKDGNKKTKQITLGYLGKKPVKVERYERVKDEVKRKYPALKIEWNKIVDAIRVPCKAIEVEGEKDERVPCGFSTNSLKELRENPLTKGKTDEEIKEAMALAQRAFEGEPIESIISTPSFVVARKRYSPGKNMTRSHFKEIEKCKFKEQTPLLPSVVRNAKLTIKQTREEVALINKGYREYFLREEVNKKGEKQKFLDYRIITGK